MAGSPEAVAVAAAAEAVEAITISPKTLAPSSVLLLFRNWRVQ